MMRNFLLTFLGFIIAFSIFFGALPNLNIVSAEVSALTIVNTSINSNSIIADGSTQYTITESAYNPGGGENIDSEYVVIGHQGVNSRTYRGYVGWTKTSTFLSWGTTYTSPISCSGGGLAAIYTGLAGPDYTLDTGSQYINLLNCSTSVSGNIRTVTFTVSFNPSFTTPVNNTLSGWVHTISGVFLSVGSDSDGWKQFGTFSIATSSPAPTAASPIPTISTSEYRCSDIKFNKDDPESSSSASPAWVSYQNADLSGEPIKFSYTFVSNVTQGNNLTLFCQFKASDGTLSQVYQKSIKYIGGDPKITNISCGYDPTGTGTQVTVKGLNFGNHVEESSGSVKLADKDTDISYWAEGGTSTDSAALNYKIIGKIRDKLAAGKYNVFLVTDDGRIATGSCTIGITTMDFKLKTNCVPSIGNLALSNVPVDVTEKADKAKSILKKKISIDAEGKPVDFNPELEVGKTYTLTIRGPKTISKKIEFTASEGTTTLDDIILPVGDIYPVSSPDNVVNVFDKGEMGREWNITNDVTRPADLNNDMRVNSVDYSCLLSNFNQIGS